MRYLLGLLVTAQTALCVAALLRSPLLAPYPVDTTRTTALALGAAGAALTLKLWHDAVARRAFMWRRLLQLEHEQRRLDERYQERERLRQFRARQQQQYERTSVGQRIRRAQGRAEQGSAGQDAAAPGLGPELLRAYATLNLLPGVEAHMAEAAYRRAMKTAHPDAGGNAAAACALTEAIETIRTYYVVSRVTEASS